MTREELEGLEKSLRKLIFSNTPSNVNERVVLEDSRQLVKYYIEKEQHEAEAYDGPTAQE